MMYLTVLLLGVVMVPYSQACSCLPAHPQTLFCNADFVMQVRLRPSGNENYDNIEENDYRYWEKHNYQRFYNIKINRIFNLKNNSFGYDENTRVGKIVTPATGSLCGVYLEKNVKYIISGKFSDDGKLSLISCNSWVLPWPHVTKTMRKNLRFKYERNCQCEIVDPDYIHNDNAEIPQDSCIWKYNRDDSDCYVRYSTCVYDINSTTGGCKWYRNRHLRQCRKESKNPVFEP